MFCKAGRRRSIPGGLAAPTIIGRRGPPTKGGAWFEDTCEWGPLWKAPNLSTYGQLEALSTEPNGRYCAGF